MTSGGAAGQEVALVVNPVHGSAQRSVSMVERLCEDYALAPPLVLPTTVAEPGGSQAAQALAQGATAVLVAGGDGTVREVAAALAGQDVPLGIIPSGTANLFARNLRLPIRSPQTAARIALGVTPGVVTTRADLGRVRALRPGGQAPSDLVFLVLVGIGHDADTVASTRPALKRRLRWGAYFEPGLRRLASRLIPVTLELDGGPVEECLVWSVLVGSCGRIPAGVDVLPGARPDDGLLHVARVSPRTVLDWGPIALTGALRRRREVPGLTYRAARVIRITSPTPRTVQVDGDPWPGVCGLDIRVDPGAVPVRSPGTLGR